MKTRSRTEDNFSKFYIVRRNDHGDKNSSWSFFSKKIEKSEFFVGSMYMDGGIKKYRINNMSLFRIVKNILTSIKNSYIIKIKKIIKIKLTYA